MVFIRFHSFIDWVVKIFQHYSNAFHFSRLKYEKKVFKIFALAYVIINCPSILIVLFFCQEYFVRNQYFYLKTKASLFSKKDLLSNFSSIQIKVTDFSFFSKRFYIVILLLFVCQSILTTPSFLMAISNSRLYHNYSLRINL